MQKVIRQIDKRNALYGDYKYQILPWRIKDAKSWQIRSWCSDTFGPEAESRYINGVWVWGLCNPKWKVTKRGRNPPLIYLASDSEATIFSLKWI